MIFVSLVYDARLQVLGWGPYVHEKGESFSRLF